MESPIYHLVPAAEWAALPPHAAYLPAAFAQDGFIHATAGVPLLLRVANTFYRGVAGAFVVLEIDPALLTSALRWEPPQPGDTLAPLFPHIYGPLNREAVVGVHEVSRAEDGTFLAVG